MATEPGGRQRGPRWRGSARGPWHGSARGPWRGSARGPWHGSARGPWHGSGRGPWHAQWQGTDGPHGAPCPLPGPAGHGAAPPGGDRPSWFAGYRLAAVVAAITLGPTFAWHAQSLGHAGRELNPAGWALLAVVCAALALRLRAPATTLVIVSAGVAAYFGLGNPAGTIFLPLTIAIGGTILAGYRLLAWLSCPVLYAFIVWGPHYLAGTGPTPSLSEAVTDAAWPLLILIGAEMLRAGRERAASAARGRAEHARRQAEQARRRTSEERVRIAQELHDVVAHNISLINVQAGVALHLMDSEGDRSPEQARDALAAIKQASKETLGELRSVLGILRAEPGTEAPLTPTAGLEQLDGLIAGAVSAGLSVQTEITGDRVPLPPSTNLAAYRIVQEALTNVIKHVGPAAVTVRLRYGETSLTMEVTDDGGASAGGGSMDAASMAGASTSGARTGGARTGGASAGATITGGGGRTVAGGRRAGDAGDADDAGEDSADGGGSGIPGMRERTRMLGGEFSAGAQSTGGFRVLAVLPLRRSDAATAGEDREDGSAHASRPPTDATAAEPGTGAAHASAGPADGEPGAGTAAASHSPARSAEGDADAGAAPASHAHGTGRDGAP